MPATYEPIASVTLGSATASHTFSSIPGTFTDLVLVNQIQHTATSRTASIRFNGDTGTNYSYTFITGNGSSASSGRVSNDSLLNIAVNTGSTAQIITNVIHVMSYANTNVNKTVLVSWNNADVEVLRHVGLWRSTAAITSLTVTSNGNMASGTTLSLYGIKAA